MYTSLIIDDEKAQQDLLDGMLKESFPFINVVEICSSVNDGLKAINKHQPDLVFLDVLLPPETGFDLLNKIEQKNFEIIFTTSYQEFALKAFKTAAVDYLLKPFGKSELQEALKKFTQKYSAEQRLLHIETLMQNVNNNTSEKIKIALPTQTGFIFVQVGEIIRCESDNTYTTFFLADKRKIVVSKTLKEYEILLVDYGFFRVHNSHMINLRYIKEYIKGEGGIVKMTDGTEVDVSRRKKDEFLRVLNKI